MKSKLPKRYSLALLPALSLAIGLASFPPVKAQTVPRPNVIFLLADDLGWADVGWHGDEIKTPHLDGLAAAGVRLERHYGHPVCSPSRAALLTGRYGFRIGINVALTDGAAAGLPAGIATLPGVLQAAGYETALAGKWHLGHSRPEYLPTRLGFEHQYGGYDNPQSYWTHRNHSGQLDWHRNDGPAFEERGYATDLQGDEAVRRIKHRDRSRPLFLLLSFNAPHQPLQAPRSYLDRYPALNGKRQAYAAMVSCLDDQVGRVRAALESEGMLDNTIIIFQSDNGGNLRAAGSNLPLRGGKHTHYEGGTRVVSFAYYPAKWRPRVVNELTHTVDWLPTLAHECQAELPAGIDGRDISDVLSGEATSPHEDGLLVCYGPKWLAYRTRRWKIVREKGWKLFDVERDENRAVRGRGSLVQQLQAAADAVIEE